MERSKFDSHVLSASQFFRLLFRATRGAFLCFVAALTAGAQNADQKTVSAPAKSVSSSTALTFSGAPQFKDGLYILQKGDELTVKVLGYPALEETVKIRPDGKMSILLANEVQAAGLTVEELRANLTTQYAVEYVRPRVSVIVRSFVNLKIYVGGEVEHPGLIPIAGDMSALGAVLQAGGFRVTARSDSVILLRNDGHDQPLVSRLNLKDVLNRGGSDVPLQSFDVVYVPKSRIATLDRFVEEFRQAVPLTLTGGFTYLLGNNSSVIRFQ